MAIGLESIERPVGGQAAWHRVCAVDELELAWGEAALVDGKQLALFRVEPGGIYAVAQQDPATLANVMARGITGCRAGRPTIASPLHKEVYDLQTGECFTTPGLRLDSYATRIVDGFIEVAV